MCMNGTKVALVLFATSRARECLAGMQLEEDKSVGFGVVGNLSIANRRSNDRDDKRDICSKVYGVVW